MTLKQKNEISSVKYFIRGKTKVSSKDKLKFLDYSEKGIIPKRKTTKGYMALLEGKKWRDIHMNMWEEGVLDGSVPYFDLLKGLSEAVVNFMAKDMFGGIDEKLILKLYKEK